MTLETNTVDKDYIFCVIVKEEHIEEKETVTSGWRIGLERKAKMWFQERDIHHVDVLKINDNHWVYRR